MFVEDGSWYCFRYVILFYCILKLFLDWINIKGLEVYVIGWNFIFIMDYLGVDFEVSLGGVGVFGIGFMGMDNLGIFLIRGVDFGFRLSF